MEAMEQLKREGSIGHIGLGCVEHENHHAVLDDGRVDVILTVNDCNLVRRYGLDQVYPRAVSQDVGILNAGIFYMGLLGGLHPEMSFSMGFKKHLNKHELVRLATDMFDFCEKRGTSLRKAALQFALSQEGVSTVPVGCRTAFEVHGLINAYEEPDLDEEFWSSFETQFQDRVTNFDIGDHWYYSKAESEVL